MELHVFPDPILTKPCADVEIGDKSVLPILDEMAEKLYEWSGAGLAAPQVGILKKLVVIDVRDEPPVLYKMINPKIIWKSDELIESREGCLSLPLLRETVKRHEKVKVEYFDTNFQKQILEAEDFLSCCIQHELDHLKGTLYIDRLSRIKYTRAVNKFHKLQQSGGTNSDDTDEE